MNPRRPDFDPTLDGSARPINKVRNKVPPPPLFTEAELCELERATAATAPVPKTFATEPTLELAAPPPRITDGSTDDAQPPQASRREQVLKAQPNPPASVRTIGRYVVLRELGRGGMGAVYEAEDPMLDRRVAVKVMLKSAGTALERFRLEARATAQLEHPNILPVHEAGLDDRTPFMVMKLIRGSNLKAFIKERRPSLVERLGIMIKVCAALSFAHSRGWIHRDIKPDNVMVGEFGDVLVMDWGLAKQQTDSSSASDSDVASLDTFEQAVKLRPELTLDGAILGTPSYMSPEQARGAITELDARSDVYALGALLYFLLTDTPPYQGRDVEALLKAARAGRLESPRHRAPGRVPLELEAVCLKAMARKPDARYASAADLAADLSAYLAHAPLRAYRGGPVYRLTRAVQRRPALSLGLAALAMLLLVTGGLLAFWGADAAARRAETEAAQAKADGASAREREERLARLAKDGQLDQLQRELGVTKVKSDRDVALYEFDGRLAEGLELGVPHIEVMKKMGIADQNRYLAAFLRVIAASEQISQKLYTAKDLEMVGYIYLYGKNDPETAERWAERILHEAANDHERAMAYACFARCADVRKEPDQKIGLLLKRVRDLDPSSTVGAELYGLFLAQTGSWSEAAVHLRFALQPGTPMRRNLTTRLRYATALAQLSQYQEAEEQTRAALQISPNDPIVLEYHARVLVGLGREREALQYAEAALGLYVLNSNLEGQKNLREMVKVLSGK